MLFFLWKTPAEFLREEWSVARVAFVNFHADSLTSSCRSRSDPSASHNESCAACGFDINSVHPLTPQTRSWDVWTRQDQCPSSTGPELQWDKDQAWPSVTDLQRPWYSSGSIANGAVTLQLLSQAHFTWLRNTITPLPPSQPLEKPPLHITWLARHSWINFLLSTPSWVF